MQYFGALSTFLCQLLLLTEMKQTALILFECKFQYSSQELFLLRRYSPLSGRGMVSSLRDMATVFPLLL